MADDLHIPQHVLRFWETKFPQVKPLKRGGGRRYYRPDDIALLRRISDLLYIQGYTIKGVQRLLRDGGGRLSDDIPPPSADEQAAAEAERDAAPPLEPELPMPGLLPPSPAAAGGAGERAAEGRSRDRAAAGPAASRRCGNWRRCARCSAEPVWDRAVWDRDVWDQDCVRGLGAARPAAPRSERSAAW